MKAPVQHRPILAGGAVYLVALAAVVAYTALSFRGFYTATVPSGENDVLATYRDYRLFLHPVGLALAVYLGVWAAALPWIRFPNDQYSVGAAWFFGNAVPLAVTWMLATLFARPILGRPRTAAA